MHYNAGMVAFAMCSCSLRKPNFSCAGWPKFKGTFTKDKICVEVWVAQGAEPHQAHVQTTFQAYMRGLEFRIDHTVNCKEGINYRSYLSCSDGLPSYINRGGYLEGLEARFYKVSNDAAVQRCCGHDCSDPLHAHGIAFDELQHSHVLS